MSDDAEIRRANLNRLCKARGWKSADLAAHTGRGYSFYPPLLKGPKSFGEKLARDLEHELEPPRGWLDRADEVPAHAAGAVSANYLVPKWPFTLALYKAVEHLDSGELEHLENVMRAHLRLTVISAPPAKKQSAA